MIAFPVIILLVITAVASPVLTVGKLLQQKEWRLDRLLDHSRERGVIRSIFGVARPLIGLIWIVMILMLKGLDFDIATQASSILIVLLLSLTLLGSMQAGVGRQRMPVWTLKACIVTLGAFLIPTGIVMQIGKNLTLQTGIGIGLIAVAGALWPIISWTLFQPIDLAIKYRIFRKAEKLRTKHPYLRVIGITGSVGKTTMKGLIAHILRDKQVVSTPEHMNSDVGVARWFSKFLESEPPDSNRIVIVEMGAYRLKEIALLCQFVKPTIGVITFIGTQHLSLFGSKENILKGKRELFESLPAHGLAFTNSDQHAFEALKEGCKCPIIGVGTDHHATKRIFDIEETTNGIKFTFEGTQFHSALEGTHSANGIAIAIAVAEAVGVPPKEAAKSIPSFKRMNGTFEAKNINGVTVLDDSYNSSPESVSAAIRWAKARPEREKILLLEGIIELGDEEESIHQEIGEEAATVFNVVYTAHSKHRAYLLEALNERVKPAAEGGPVESGSLLVICGRVRPEIVQRFLPHA